MRRLLPEAGARRASHNCSAAMGDTRFARRQLTKFTSAESWRVLDMDFLEDGILYVALAVFYVDSPLDCDCYFFCGLSLF